MSPTVTTTDVLVIGGGPAGYAAALRAAHRGAEVALVEREGVGGTCLNHGCIPSKALIAATDLAHRAGSAGSMGIHADPSVDVPAMISWKEGIVQRLTGGVERLLEAAGVAVIPGEARFESDARVAVVDPADGSRDGTLEFQNAVIATGSRPTPLPGLAFDGDRVLDSRAALALEEPPAALAIVGAGYIGMELAGVFAKLGTDVTVIEALDGILPRYDEDLTAPVLRRARALGVSVRTGRTVDGADVDEAGVTLVTGDAELRVDRTLVAVGREPVVDSLDLEAVGIELDDEGAIPVDTSQRTAREGLFAVGDVTGEPMLAHVGIAEGTVAAETIAGDGREFDHVAIPEVVFTDPEVAVVGLDEPTARERGHDPVVGEFPLRANGRAMTADRRDGIVRLVAEADTRRLLGGAIVGVHASELIGELALALEMDATLEDVAHAIHPHPTISESVSEAADHALGVPLHRPRE